MIYPLLALLLFWVAVTLHVFFCRTTTQRGLHASVFCVIAGVFWAIYGFAALLVESWDIFDPHSLWGWPFKISGGIIFILLVPVYLSFYVLTQLTSPSKKILLAISQSGELTHADILAIVQKENFIGTRLDDLCTSGCVEMIRGRYVLTPEGRKIAATLDFMQLILGREVGG
jgi:hypothetical protein